ncbi:MAG: cupredoxin domain-containing protein [Candidatus Doudnabacteria bacterium]|nr:cupredoxin domain-containing protein [Candidatus Doudnabacteria bacterium]
MAFNNILVTILGVAAIGFIYWFFLMKKETETVAGVTDQAGQQQVDITVDGGYLPAIISLTQGKLAKLNFFRKDSSSCLEEVVMPDFKVRQFLPLNQKITIEIRPQKSGEYNFSCGMGMFHGKLIVK